MAILALDMLSCPTWTRWPRSSQHSVLIAHHGLTSKSGTLKYLRATCALAPAQDEATATIKPG